MTKKEHCKVLWISHPSNHSTRSFNRKCSLHYLKNLNRFTPISCYCLVQICVIICQYFSNTYLVPLPLAVIHLLPPFPQFILHTIISKAIFQKFKNKEYNQILHFCFKFLRGSSISTGIHLNDHLLPFSMNINKKLQ